MQFEWTSYSEVLMMLRLYLNYLNTLTVRIFTEVQEEGIPHLNPKSNMFTEANWLGYTQAPAFGWTLGPHSPTLHANASVAPAPVFVNNSGVSVFPRGMFMNSTQTSVANVVAWGYFKEDQSPIEIIAGGTFSPQITCLVKSQWIIGIEEEE